MQVDWFTVVAQVINFLVLVYLLKRFLYGPIIDAIDDIRVGSQKGAHSLWQPRLDQQACA